MQCCTRCLWIPTGCPATHITRPETSSSGGAFRGPGATPVVGGQLMDPLAVTYFNGCGWSRVRESGAYHGALLLADTHIGRVIVVGREGPGRPNTLDTLWLFTGNWWMAAPATALV